MGDELLVGFPRLVGFIEIERKRIDENRFAFKKSKVKRSKSGLPMISSVIKMLGTFLLVAFGLILFRSSSIGEAGSIIHKIATSWGSLFVDYKTLINGILCMFILLIKDVRDEYLPDKHTITNATFNKYRFELTVSVYIILILFFGVLDGNQFIYFKF